MLGGLPITKIILLLHCNRPDGGIGRRAGLKHQWIYFHAGSIPALGTFKVKPQLIINQLRFFHL